MDGPARGAARPSRPPGARTAARGRIVHIRLPYGSTEVELAIPARNLMAVVGPEAQGAGEGPPPVSEADEAAEVRRALREPIGSPRLAMLARRASTAAVVVSDVTRPCPTYKFLPAILDELSGVAVTVVFALGAHRKHTREEQAALIGHEALERADVVDLDREDCLSLGVTSRGTPLEVFRPFLEADLRICTGNIEYHYFAGFSGGAKAVMPGICTHAAIEANHGMMLSSHAKAGILEGNPVREDIDEAGGIAGIDFIFNVILDEEKRILRAVAGHYVDAFRAGARFYDEVFDLAIEAPADVVVASPGGRPKDINLYQAQKTLDCVRGAVRKGGAVILVAECVEGFGQATFEEWMRGMSSPGALVERIRREFVLGGHKAAAVADLLGHADVYLVSAFPADVVREMGMTPSSSVAEAVGAALERCGSEARFVVVPHGHRVRVRSG